MDLYAEGEKTKIAEVPTFLIFNFENIKNLRSESCRYSERIRVYACEACIRA